MKIWTSTQKGSDKIIAYYNDTLYKANPGATKMEAYVQDLQYNKEAAKGFFTIPLHYISSISLQEGKSYIEVQFRGDTETLKIADAITRNEVFDYLSQHMPGATVQKLEKSKWQVGKKPLIAMLVIIAIGTWAIYIAHETENGATYDVVGQKYHSLAGIVLALASLGVKKLCLIVGGLLAIAGFSFFQKTRQPYISQVLTFTR
jgi:hypothetical protein